MSIVRGSFWRKADSRLHSAIFIVFVLTILQACTPAPESPLRIGTNVWPGYEPLYLARDLGYFDESRVRLVEYPNSTEVMRSFRNGTIEIAALTLDEMVTLVDEGLNPRIILVMDISHGADAIIGQPGIDSLKALKNKRVGVEATALGAFFLSRALDSVGMLSSDLNIVPLPVNLHLQAFLDKEVDAVVTFEPESSKLLAEGGKLLFDSSKVPGEIVDVLVVKDELTGTRDDALSALLSNWFAALDYINARPRDAYQRMAKRSALSTEEYALSMDGLKIPNRQKNVELMDGFPSPLLNTTTELSRVMKEHRLISRYHYNSERIYLAPIKQLQP